MAIYKCTCKHEYQDEKYGKGNRVFNFAVKAKEIGGSEGWRCTVCGNVRPKG